MLGFQLGYLGSPEFKLPSPVSDTVAGFLDLGFLGSLDLGFLGLPDPAPPSVVNDTDVDFLNIGFHVGSTGFLDYPCYLDYLGYLCEPEPELLLPVSDIEAAIF